MAIDPTTAGSSLRYARATVGGGTHPSSPQQRQQHSRRRGRAAMALLGATAAVMLAGGEAFRMPVAPQQSAGRQPAATRLAAEQPEQGQQQRQRGCIGTGGKWIRQRPAAARPQGGSLLLQLGASLTGGVVDGGVRAASGARGAAAGAGAAAAAEKEERRRRRQEGEGVEEWMEEDALLIPTLAGAAAGGSFQVFAEAGYTPAVPSFLASAWSSLSGSSGGGGGEKEAEVESLPLTGLRMMDEGDAEKGTEEDESVVLAAPNLLQQPPLPSVMEPSPPPPKPDFNRNDNFTINLGRALDHLRVDVPLMFDRESDMSIFTEDIRLRDERRVYANGKFMYQMVLFSLRLAKVFMPMPPLVEVLNIRWCPARQCIYVRFQIRVDTLSDQLYFDATSVYKVNSQGMIYEHIIENVIRNDLVEKPSIVSLFYTTRQILVGAPGAGPIPDSVGM